ncbi:MULTISPECIES: hypothetical protein [Alteribacter]|uniref:Uncharacterized protein n=1 Tax=Alteribacter keqinensis TaxID=2483800 RepID=A0A3M7TQF6_9BACI|nr:MULTISPECIES: hypothetical protein [Alteribacter]MBM7094756.1 hypothetical protein [Alteribacter salitolerans]RNA66580.1 hypothetical protein EBO34_15275 [Alteribacter keqinensis]
MGIIPIMGCCPFFSNQSTENITLPLNPQFQFVPILSVDVTTTEDDERVRIDSMINSRISTFNAGSVYTSRLTFRIIRTGGVEIVETDWHMIDIAKPVGSGSVFRQNQNLTWTDTPPGPDTYTYTLQVRRGTGVFEGNIESVIVGVRSIDAIVFPPSE